MVNNVEKLSLGVEDTLLTLEDVLSYKISPGKIFWVKKNKTKVLMRNPGDPIDPKYFAKFEKINCEFSLTESVRIAFINDSVSLFRNLSASEFEEEKWRIRYSYLSRLKRNFLASNSQASLLEFVLIGMKSFLNLDPKLEEVLIAYSVNQYRRSALGAMIAVSMAMTVGYLDFRFLQDIYHLFFVQDLSFAYDGGNYIFSKALECERLENQGAQKTFQSFSQKIDSSKFYKHAEISLEVFEKFTSPFHQEGWEKLIGLHHEKFDGNGFQLNLNADEFSDLEAIYIYVNTMLSYEDIDFSNQNAGEYLLSIFNKQSQNNHEQRLLTNINFALEKIDEDREAS